MIGQSLSPCGGPRGGPYMYMACLGWTGAHIAAELCAGELFSTDSLALPHARQLCYLRSRDD